VSGVAKLDTFCHSTRWM